MKLREAPTSMHKGVIVSERRWGIDATALSHIMSQLTSLYSDPALAVIREYSTNALDSHVQAGNPDPIQITLPSGSSPDFVVEDFGVGLSHSEIENLYSMYGASTKRDSDDFVGALGFGCKSALAYTSQFTLEAVKDGESSTCLILKDTDGVGVIKTLDVSPTSAPNGVRVTIPVADVHAFLAEATKFFSFWKPGTVLVDGEAPNFIGDNPDVLVLDDRTLVLPTGVYGGSRYGTVVMGNVPYPSSWLNLNNSHRIIKFVDIGDVDIVPSREALKDTDRTSALVKRVRDEVTESIKGIIEYAAALQPTPWARWLFAAENSQVARSFGVDLKRSKAITFPADPENPYKDPPLSWSVDHFTARQVTHGNLGSEMLATSKTEGGIVVTGFPMKRLAEGHKVRLNIYTNKTFGSHVSTNALLLPPEADISGIEGFPHIVEWSEIASITPPRSERSAPADTTWVLRTYGVGGASEQVSDTIEGDPVVWLSPRENIRNYNLLRGQRWLYVYAKDKKAFLKKNPTAMTPQEYHDQLKIRAERYMDARLWRYSVLSYGRVGLFRKLAERLDEILDPRFGVWAEAASLKPSSQMFGLAQRFLVPPGGLDDELRELFADYPLIDNTYDTYDIIDEIIYYINGKYKEYTK